MYTTVALALFVLIILLPPVLLLLSFSETRVAMCLWRKMPIRLLESFNSRTSISFLLAEHAAHTTLTKHSYSV